MGTSNDWSEQKRTEKTGKIKKIHKTFFLCAKKKTVLKFVCRTLKTAPFLPGTRLELARRLTSEGF